MKIKKNTINIGVLKIPVIPVRLDIWDIIGMVKVRFGINRKKYRVGPGIYAIGNPTASSEVFVSANYKYSFDILRNSLKGMSCWILVLDTNGINVWCAAGKGTFGTEELIKRINDSSLKSVVTHKRLILPQLAAVGVAKHKINKETGFDIIYGPVYAKDINAFIASGHKATENMRKIRFGILDRLILLPMEINIGMKYLLWIIPFFILIAGIAKAGYSVNLALSYVKTIISILIFALLSGTFFAPLLMNVIPGRSFALKGGFTGLVTYLLIYNYMINTSGLMEKIAWFFLVIIISSFTMMNFTGTSTFTSLSGVKKEMNIAVPIQLAGGVAGILLFIMSRFI